MLTFVTLASAIVLVTSVATLVVVDARFAEMQERIERMEHELEALRSDSRVMTGSRGNFSLIETSDTPTRDDLWRIIGSAGRGDCE